MFDNIREKFFKYVTVTVILAVVLIGGMTAYPTWQRGKNLQREEAELRQRIDQKKREIARLKSYQNRFRGDAEFVESIARQNRRIFPGELVFVFED